MRKFTPPSIYPVNGMHMWVETGFANVLPPNKRALPDIPKKNRRLEAWEIKKNHKELSKCGMRKKCGICKELGHK